MLQECDCGNWPVVCEIALMNFGRELMESSDVRNKGDWNSIVVFLLLCEWGMGMINRLLCIYFHFFKNNYFILRLVFEEKV